MTPPTVFVCVHTTSISHPHAESEFVYLHRFISCISHHIFTYIIRQVFPEKESKTRETKMQRETETQNELLLWKLTPTTKWLLTQAVDWFLTQLWTYSWSWLHIYLSHMLTPSPGHRIIFDPSPETSLWLWPPRPLTPIHWRPTLSGNWHFLISAGKFSLSWSTYLVCLSFLSSMEVRRKLIVLLSNQIGQS